MTLLFQENHTSPDLILMTVPLVVQTVPSQAVSGSLTDLAFQELLIVNRRTAYFQADLLRCLS